MLGRLKGNRTPYTVNIFTLLKTQSIYKTNDRLNLCDLHDTYIFTFIPWNKALFRLHYTKMYDSLQR